jgi:hypothetical protein
MGSLSCEASPLSLLWDAEEVREALLSAALSGETDPTEEDEYRKR